MTGADPATPAEPPSQPPSGWWRRHYTRTRAIAAGATAAALSGFAILEGVFNLFPGLKGDEPCARVHAAELAEPTLDRLVTRREALERQGASTDGVPPERLAEPGKFVSFDVTATGFEDDRLELRTWLLTADGAPVPTAELRDLLVEEWRPDGCEDSKRVQVWSPVPDSPGQFLIQIQVRPAGSREVLDEVRTEKFSAES